MREAGFDTQMGGNIGTAILSLDPPASNRVHVVEMSSYQVDLTPSLHPSVGILLNVTEDHIDRHGSIEHYAEVKERLVMGVPRGGTAIVGVDDSLSAATADRAEHAGIHTVRISVQRKLANGVYLDGEKLYRSASGEITQIAYLHGIGSLRGTHNAQNAACAASAALALGVPFGVVQNGLRSFPGLAHRMEQIGVKDRVLFVNDSKGTNADATARALSSFGDIFWIAGGKPKSGGIESLRKFFPRIRKAYLIGEAGSPGSRRRSATCRTKSAVRLMRPCRTPRATRRPPALAMRWCCSLQLAPRSISFRISRCAAIISANWCRRCRHHAGLNLRLKLT